MNSFNTTDTTSKLNLSNPQNRRTIRFLFLILTLICCGWVSGLKAQTTGLNSIYFQNQYLENPAMAGISSGLALNLDYQQHTNAGPGGPVVQSLSADFDAGKNVGLGIILSNDKAGLLSRTNAMGTFAYHVNLNETDRLNFGLSMGLVNASLNNSQINGDQTDPSAQKYNYSNTGISGGVGIAYLRRGLTLQASIPELHVFSNNNDSRQSDHSVFYSAASYLIPLSSGSDFTLEPKVAMRVIQQNPTIYDGGVNLSLQPYHVSISGMYHTDKSYTVAAGLNLRVLDLMLSYTNSAGSQVTYLSNTLEVGLRFTLFSRSH